MVKHLPPTVCHYTLRAIVFIFDFNVCFRFCFLFLFHFIFNFFVVLVSGTPLPPLLDFVISFFPFYCSYFDLLFGHNLFYSGTVYLVIVLCCVVWCGVVLSLLEVWRCSFVPPNMVIYHVLHSQTYHTHLRVLYCSSMTWLGL